MKAEMEALQGRQMLSVAASVGAGTLYVYGNNEGNGLAIETANASKDIVVKKYVGGTNYQEFYRTKASNVQNIKVYGRGGPDTITVADFVSAHVTIVGGAGADYLQPGGLVALAFGNDESFIAPDDNAADMLVTGGSGECTLYGQGGDDRFYMDRSKVPGIGGSDYFFGGAGNDRFYAKRDQRHSHSYDGGSGNDTVDFSNYDAPVRISLDGTRSSGTLSGSALERNHRIKTNVENAVGSAQSDLIIGTLTADTANRLFGLGGADTIFGNGGNDLIDGGSSADYIDAGFGNDTVFGSSGNDRIHGAGGDDSLNGGSGHDSMLGGDGADKLFGDAGNDTIAGESGADILVGGADNDLLNSSDGIGGNDVLFGNTQSSIESSAYDRAIINFGSPLSDFTFGLDAVTT